MSTTVELLLYRSSQRAVLPAPRSRMAAPIKSPPSTLKEEKKRKDRERAAAWRKTEDYARWLESSRQRRIELKRKYRREAGARSRESIAEEARIKAARLEAKRADRIKAAMEFVGPPRPSSSKNNTAYVRLRYQTDAKFQEKEKARVAANKATVPTYYARQMLGLGHSAPDELVEAKRLQLLIKKHIRSKQDEKH